MGIHRQRARPKLRAAPCGEQQSRDTSHMPEAEEKDCLEREGGGRFNLNPAKVLAMLGLLLVAAEVAATVVKVVVVVVVAVAVAAVMAAAAATALASKLPHCLRLSGRTHTADTRSACSDLIRGGTSRGKWCTIQSRHCTGLRVPTCYSCHSSRRRGKSVGCTRTFFPLCTTPRTCPGNSSGEETGQSCCCCCYRGSAVPGVPLTAARRRATLDRE